MFREMRRKKQALDQRTCERILSEEKRGVLAVIGTEDYPYAIPMNFYFAADKQAIYLHSAITGHKVDAITRDNRVCFTTWNKGVQQEGDWSYFVDSVIVFGRAHIVENEEERLTATKRFGLKYYPTEEEVDKEIERDLPRMLLIRIDIEHMSGKHIHER